MDTSESVGEQVKRRRDALRLSQPQLSERAGVHRNTVGKIEHDDPHVRPHHVAAVLKALDEMERRYGAEDPDEVVWVMELPDGTKITATGSPAGVAESAQAFLSNRGT